MCSYLNEKQCLRILKLNDGFDTFPREKILIFSTGSRLGSAIRSGISLVGIKQAQVDHMFREITSDFRGVGFRFRQVCCKEAIPRSIWKRFAVFATVGFSILLLYLCLFEVRTAFKGLKFIKTTCLVNKSEVTEILPCSCESYTKVACYPCLKILVFLDLPWSNGSKVFTNRKLAYLYDSLYVLDQKCFFRPPSCCHSNDQNKQAVEAVENEIRNRGVTISCYFNPHNSSEVILHRHSYELIIINSFVWPTAGIAMGIFILRYLRKLNMHEDRDKLKRLLKQARKKKLSVIVEDVGKPELLLNEDIWVMREEASS